MTAGLYLCSALHDLVDLRAALGGFVEGNDDDADEHGGKRKGAHDDDKEKDEHDWPAECGRAATRAVADGRNNGVALVGIVLASEDGATGPMVRHVNPQPQGRRAAAGE